MKEKSKVQEILRRYNGVWKISELSREVSDSIESQIDNLKKYDGKYVRISYIESEGYCFKEKELEGKLVSVEPSGIMIWEPGKTESTTLFLKSSVATVYEIRVLPEEDIIYQNEKAKEWTIVLNYLLRNIGKKNKKCF